MRAKGAINLSHDFGAAGAWPLAISRSGRRKQARDQAPAIERQRKGGYVTNEIECEQRQRAGLGTGGGKLVSDAKWRYQYSCGSTLDPHQAFSQ